MKVKLEAVFKLNEGFSRTQIQTVVKELLDEYGSDIEMTITETDDQPPQKPPGPPH